MDMFSCGSFCNSRDRGLALSSKNASLQAHTTPLQSSNYGGFTSEVMWKLVEIVAEHGAEFAYPTHVNIHQNALPKLEGA